MSQDEINLQIFVDDFMTCALIDAQTKIEEMIIGTPGPDGEDPLENWEPKGFLNVQE